MREQTFVCSGNSDLMASFGPTKYRSAKSWNRSSSPARQDVRPACGEPRSTPHPSSSSSVRRDRFARNVVPVELVNDSGRRKETLPGTTYTDEHNHRKEVSASVSGDVSSRNRGKAVDVLNPAGGSVSGDGVRQNWTRVNVGNEELNPREESRFSREEVKSVLGMFWKSYNKLKEENAAESSKHPRQTIHKAATTIKSRWLNTEHLLGHVPGVEIGDRFRLRAELKVIGLHRHHEKGIDYMNKDGTLLATSIVATRRYDNYIERSTNSLVYIGHGGNTGEKSDERRRDQKLEQGNRALYNSMEARTPVRVILLASFKKSIRSTIGCGSSQNNRNSEYVYDGLYKVDECRQRRGKSGKLVYEFVLNRYADQSKLYSSTKFGHRRMCVLMNDISEQKEYVPIRVVNGFDGERPPSFTYITRVIYPVATQSHLNCCDCNNCCSDSEDCACKVKNGGIPYSSKEAVTCRNSVIYECGPSCKCNESCINRVSQRGIRFELEIFRTQTGWGVRSRSYIPAGRFVCEFVGEVRRQKEIVRGNVSGDYLFDMGNHYDALTLQHSSRRSRMENDGFIIDATRSGNVGRFIKHSCSPNLYAQKVLYDNSDVKMPHIMLFSMKNIPPQQELTFVFICQKFPLESSCLERTHPTAAGTKVISPTRKGDNKPLPTFFAEFNQTGFMCVVYVYHVSSPYDPSRVIVFANVHLQQSYYRQQQCS